MSIHRAACLALAALLASSSVAAEAPLGNRPERLEWFRDQGLGLFIHWSVDSQLGLIISHSLAGSSRQYQDRFYRELPATFDPTHFEPDALARLARLSGFRYMMFTAKHHNGFAMWDTRTTDFSIMHTPYAQDVTRQLFDAFRRQGVPPGVYFSPDDFHWLYQHDKPINRRVDAVQPSSNPGLLALDRAQMNELMTQYGPIVAVFFDGESKDLKDIVWQHQPDSIVTRGAIETPEQNIPGAALPGAWESCMTMGTAWGWQTSDERYKSAGELIQLLVRTRARGGNLLLNIAPRADGSLPIEQEQNLRTLGAWLFINGEAIYGVRPWAVTHEGDIWYTRSKDRHALYAIVDDGKPGEKPWPRGTWREFVLKTVRASASTTVSVLGQSDQAVEYRPELEPRSTFRQQADGLHVRVMRAQRLRDSDAWPYPSVIRLTGVEEAFAPPVVKTLAAMVNAGGTVTLQGSWSAPQDAAGSRFGFDYRDITGEDSRSRQESWRSLGLQPAGRPGTYTASFTPQPGRSYEFRAVLEHPLLSLYGDAVPIPAR
ncbi:MAG: alpha-L-fucosidase [Pseudomonas sp.]